VLFFNSVLETATTNEQVRGEIMRKLAVIGAMAFIALTSFSSLSAFAAQSCDEYCLGFCQSSASKSWCLNKCGQTCRQKHPSH
jgi:hypothetical protein